MNNFVNQRYTEGWFGIIEDQMIFYCTTYRSGEFFLLQLPLSSLSGNLETVDWRVTHIWKIGCADWFKGLEPLHFIQPIDLLLTQQRSYMRFHPVIPMSQKSHVFTDETVNPSKVMLLYLHTKYLCLKESSYHQILGLEHLHQNSKGV